jgi:hypothetical protein
MKGKSKEGEVKTGPLPKERERACSQETKEEKERGIEGWDGGQIHELLCY